MVVTLLTEHHLEFISLYICNEAAKARLSIFMSKCHIVGNHMSLLTLLYVQHFQLKVRTMAMGLVIKLLALVKRK